MSRKNSNPVLAAPLILLVASVAINYIDRGNLSIAATLIQADLKITPAQLGVLLSAFFWTYAGFQLVSGWLVDRFDATWVLAGGFLVWTLATAATGWIGGIASLFALRLLVGMGESVCYPSYSKLLSENYDEKQRGMANSLLDAGSKCGPVIGMVLGGFLLAKFGWPTLFWVLGFGAAVWLPLWILWRPRRREAADRGPEGPVPRVRDIVWRRSALATFAGQFCSNYLWNFLLTWLPYYLVRERHFSLEKMSIVGALPYCFAAVTTLTVGSLSYRALARGATPTKVRKLCTGIGQTIATAIVFVPVISDSNLAMAFLMLAAVGHGIYATSNWAITQTLAGPLASGRWTGIQNFVGNLGGVVSPMVTGWVVSATGHFFWAFAAAAAVSLSGAVIYVFWLPRVEPVAWEETFVAEPNAAAAG